MRRGAPCPRRCRVRSSPSRRVICCGNASIDSRIARDGADAVQLEVRRTLPPVLKNLRAEGFSLTGLEQTTNSQPLTTYAFARRTAS